jgi:hypothetical protein
MNIPPDLRLPALDFPDPADMLRSLQPAGMAGAEDAGGISIPIEFAREVVSMATQVWRIHTRVIDPLEGEPKDAITREDIRRIARSLESMVGSLGQIGIEIKDRTGETFDYGLPEKVVSAQPQAGLTKERIVETMRPTIYWGNRIAQQGEVVIATPPAVSNASAPSDTPTL